MNTSVFRKITLCSPLKVIAADCFMLISCLAHSLKSEEGGDLFLKDLG
jgi:hypothetical protein